MKIGVISDTHVSRIDQLPPRLLEKLQEVDLIIHLGDYTSKELVDGLKGLGNFRGVCGNMDSRELRAELPEIDIVQVKGKSIGLTHGWGSPWEIQSRIKDRFQRVDAILYGHTHAVWNKIDEGILFFNPGSATGRLPATRKTLGILDVEESIQGEIITIG